jgi:hypothetical protein
MVCQRRGEKMAYRGTCNIHGSQARHLTPYTFKPLLLVLKGNETLPEFAM